MKYSVAFLLLGLAIAVQAKNLAFVSLKFGIFSKIDDFYTGKSQGR